MSNLDLEAIVKNLDAFALAYGLDSKSRKLAEAIINGKVQMFRVGILLRETATGKTLINCDFPVEGDFTNYMLWVPIGEKPVEAFPMCTREPADNAVLKNNWVRLPQEPGGEKYHLVEASPIRLRVHDSLCKHGVIEKYFPEQGYGFIQRSRKGVYFRKEWCTLEEIRPGKEVSFIPVISSRRGLQARAVEEIILLT